MFDKLEMAPPDAILGLTEAFVKDENPNKINLGVGVYKDENGKTPILSAVKAAERLVLEKEQTKGYLPIDGSADYGAAVRALMIGEGHEVLTSGRATTSHTPGGTGALRVAGDFLRAKLGRKKIWLSGPTWANHPSIFEAAGLEIETYPYYDAEAKELSLDAMLECLAKVPADDVVLLHGCCHNPCGMDPSPEQWKQIAQCAAEAGWLPLVDFAYQGLADSLEQDAVGLQTLLEPGQELLVCSSFSKNFGLYNERVGALTVVAASESAAAKAQSHVKKCIRVNYSNPPAHGSAIVTTVLSNPELRKQWKEELEVMCARINGMRGLFVDTLKAKGVEQDFSFITGQRGMFSFSGLTPDQVAVLRDKFSIYIVKSGRINVAGMTPANMDTLCEAIASVL